jgi:tryptophanyl-tRNA synthetase
MVAEPRSLMVSGIQPTGALMIGNYVGALSSWVELQSTHESFFMLADLHAITVPQNPAELQRRTLEFMALFLACGVDPGKSSVFLQSQVPAHTQLAWVLNCIAPMGDLQRMTQFKNKAGRAAEAVHAGLFDYPVLMAADILVYGADLVPVGDDQEQHMEFTRRIARKFNGLYGEILRIPNSYTPRTGARLMGLQTPEAKMSKSDRNADNYVALLDPPDVVRKKIRAATTDSGSEIRCDSAKPGISNLVMLYAAVSGESVESIQNRYSGKGYAEFKRHLAEVVIDFVSPLQARYMSIAADPGMLAALLNRGADRARERSEATLARVYRAIGLLPGAAGRRRHSSGRFAVNDPRPDIPMPAAHRALRQRKSAMENKERTEVAPTAAAEPGPEEEYMTDCFDCCCCDTEEDCIMAD